MIYNMWRSLRFVFYWHHKISNWILKVNTSSLQTPKPSCNSFFIWNNWINLSKYLRRWPLRKGHNKKHVLQITSLDPNFTPWKKDKKDRQLCLLNRKLLLKSLQLLCEFRKHGRNMFNFVSLVWLKKTAAAQVLLDLHVT